ncbi:ATP-binding cassette domain-containing protein, partial [Staphylococcus epidermidis]|uniref:ATP-binding cassette domain-containing protein n=1 Tax=Staphylococcus epidermidis TaxID=1282 RepID=UPI0021B3F920
MPVNNLTFNIKQPQFFLLIPPSPSPNTTTLKIINPLIPLTQPYIYFKHKPITHYPLYQMPSHIPYLLQQIPLFPHITIKQNIPQLPQIKNSKHNHIHLPLHELFTILPLNPHQFKN